MSHHLIVQEEAGQTVSDDASSIHPELSSPQGKYIKLITISMCHCVSIYHRSTQCGQALEDGERDDLGCESPLV